MQNNQTIDMKLLTETSASKQVAITIHNKLQRHFKENPDDSHLIVTYSSALKHFYSKYQLPTRRFHERHLVARGIGAKSLDAIGKYLEKRGYIKVNQFQRRDLFTIQKI